MNTTETIARKMKNFLGRIFFMKILQKNAINPTITTNEQSIRNTLALQLTKISCEFC